MCRRNAGREEPRRNIQSLLGGCDRVHCADAILGTCQRWAPEFGPSRPGHIQLYVKRTSASRRVIVRQPHTFARHLVKRGYNYFVTEPGHPFLGDKAADFGYGVFSARYGNIYTSRQLVQKSQLGLRCCPAIDPYGCTEFDSTYTAQPAITRIISLQVAPTAFTSRFRPLTLTRTGAGMRSNTASE